MNKYKVIIRECMFPENEQEYILDAFSVKEAGIIALNKKYQGIFEWEVVIVIQQ